MNYVFMTDASCDLNQKQVTEAGVEVIPMEFQMEDKCYLQYPDCRMMSHDEFYEKIKSGVESKTTQINYDTFKRYFEQYLKAGKDVLYTGISTGLSGTYNSSLMAISELQDKYPDRKIISIDSYCDSMGLGLLIYLASKKYKAGASIEELADYIKETRSKVAHWFVVDDLDQLKRGGRISSVTATFGKALQIKPLLSVEETGKLESIAKIRGKSNIVSTLVKYVERDMEKSKENIAFIGQTDNIEGAKELQKALKGMFKEIQICDIGPVVGSHVGAGLLGVVFLGTRNLQA